MFAAIAAVIVIVVSLSWTRVGVSNTFVTDRSDSRGVLSEGYIKNVAEEFELFEKSKVNPHLRFLDGDITYWYNQKLSKDDLRVEFAARQVVLRSADKQGFVIEDQGVLSLLCQKVKPYIGKEIEQQKRLNFIEMGND